MKVARVIDALSAETQELSLLTLDGAKDLSAVASSPNITRVRLPKSKRLDLSALLALPKLTTLDLASCTPTQLAIINQLPALEFLSLSKSDPSALRGLARPLTGLVFWSTKIHHHIDVALGATGLKSLEVGTKHSDLADTRPLPAFKTLETLRIASNKLKSLAPVAHLKTLQELDASRQKVLTSCRGVESLHSLTTLQLKQTGIKDIAPITGLPALERLDLTQVPVQSLAGIGECKTLRSLAVTSPKIQSLDALADHPALEAFDYWPRNRAYLEDPSALESVTQLKRLDLKTTTTDFSFLDALPGLTWLKLDAPHFDDFEALRARPDLEWSVRSSSGHHSSFGD